MTDKEKKELAEQALAAREHAYAPYSGYYVGAALLADNGRIFTGCNIENASYSVSNCAERTAVFKAVSEGLLKWKAIAVAGGAGRENPQDYVTPCGVCRQVLSEFCDADRFSVLLVKGIGDWREFTLGELLPCRFSLK